MSIATRAAWAAFASAGFAAAIAAISAIALADVLVLRQTDQHLLAAATELARDVEKAGDAAAMESAVRDEQQEATSSGIRFAVYGNAGDWLSGDRTIAAIGGPCASAGDLRICRAPTATGTYVLAATLRKSAYDLLAIAALVAAALAGIVAWGIGRVLSRRAIAPLTRLRARIATMSKAESPSRAESLGDDEGVTEVDELRATLATQLVRMHDAIDRSTQFAANAAHELRTPLTALRAELELLAESSDSRDADTTQSLHVALKKVAQLQSLTDRLLALATPHGDGAPDRGFEIVSIRDVVDEAIAGLAGEEKSRIAIADDDADVFVRGDAEDLGIAVSNGLSNALKFGQRVTIEIGEERAAGVLAIEDDGPGVPEDERARVFEPFARGGTAAGIPGRGLGLALVAHVVKRHEGEVRLSDALRTARGARLEMRFPSVATREEL